MDEIEYERKRLYEEVWEQPIGDVAERYGVTNEAIRKVCETLCIPTPPAGYWVQLYAGRNVPREPLPQFSGATTVRVPRPSSRGTSAKKASKDLLTFLPEQERQRILGICQSIEVRDKLSAPHRLIVEFLDELTARRKREKERQRRSSRSFDSYGILPRQDEDKPVLDVQVSEGQLNRACRVLHAFIRGIEELGGSIIVDAKDRRTYALMGKDRIRLKLVEKSKWIPHVLTAQEEARRKKERHFSAPPYDKVPTGELEFQFLYDHSSKRVFRDTAKRSLDSVLGTALVVLLEIGESLRVAREAQEAERRRRLEEELRRLERERLQQAELERVHTLVHKAMDWRTANEIRTYAAAVESSLSDVSDPNTLEEKKRWVQWAMEKADWLDPTVAAPDPILGLHDHSAFGRRSIRREEPYSLWP